MSLRTPETATVESIKSNAETVVLQAVRIKQLEAMIKGLMEAMKPLLDEWEKLSQNK